MFNLEAKEGYVVYRVEAWGDNAVHGLILIFAPMTDLDKGVNTTKTYESEFVGDKLGTHKTLGKFGKPAVGIVSSKVEGWWISGFGLLTHKIGKASYKGR